LQHLILQTAKIRKIFDLEIQIKMLIFVKPKTEVFFQ